MKSKKLPVLLHIALTLKTIENVFRKKMVAFPIDLPPEAFGILMIVGCHQDVIQQDIAALAKKDKSAVLRQIDLLERKSLVKRKEDSNDKRKNRIVTTKEGKKIIKMLAEREHELFLSLSQGIDAKEMATFVKVLDTLKLNAEKK
ncbi:MAG: MarR family transcriptional regulator [Bacteroidales bacterium]|jgi:DNA-binding MarR family transcriptional regulator|nr:MarR family transcriptional regulator [Bacteroidales bacterium]